jgi:hypothetical protein
MKKIPIKQFLNTPHPYRLNFPARMLLSRFRALDFMYQRVLRRPWLKNLPKRSYNNVHHSSSYIGAIPHYRTGIGHILAEWNTGLIWSQKLGLKFAHCPLRPPWNEFFGFKDFEDFSAISEQAHVRKVMLPKIQNDLDPEKSPLIQRIIKYYTRQGPCLFQLYFGQNSFRQDETSHILQEKYFAQRLIAPIPNCRREGFVNVSVHVRRPTFEDSKHPVYGDPSDPSYKMRFLDSRYYIQICKAILGALANSRVCFNVFSLGDKNDFSDFFQLPNVTLHINENDAETFHNIVMGDILILSPSSFSFKAGMVSRGAKIAASPWWHAIPENEEWCRVTLDVCPDDLNIFKFLNKIN